MSSVTTAAYLNWNYLYPQYILPWNNFFRRIQNNPFYTQSELNIITTREIQSPLTFDARPTLIGDTSSDTYANFISNLFPLNQSKTLLSTGLKQFIGRYIDSKNLSGLEYQYTYNTTFIPSTTYNSSSTSILIFGLNLAATPNSPVDNKVVFTFSKTDSNVLIPAISGTIVIDDTQLVLENFSVLPTISSWSDLDSTKQYFFILGNRIYIVVPLDETYTNCYNILLSLNVRIVEAVRTSITVPSLYVL